MFDAGDGPMVFGILIVGAIVCGLALWVEFTFQPPLWGPCPAVAAADLPADRDFSCACPSRRCWCCNTSTRPVKAVWGNEFSVPIPRSYRRLRPCCLPSFCALGVWQLERLQWKLALIARVNSPHGRSPRSPWTGSWR